MKTIRLTDKQINDLISESVARVLKYYYGDTKQINLDEVGGVSDTELFDNGNANYYFTTEEPSGNNSDTLDKFFDFVAESGELIEWFFDGSQAFGKRRDGMEIQLDAGGNGDFTSHVVSVTVI